jgi:imidazolonepropionase-like amidohydrolase
MKVYRKIVIACLSFLLFATILSACSPPKNLSTPNKIAIADVTIVDVETGSLYANQTVLIQDDLIIEISPANKAKIPKGTHIVNASGKYIIPGLWDMHTHLEAAGKEVLPVFLANGVTAVREMGANSFGLIRSWRNEIESGLYPGPHILAAGPIIDGPFITNEFRVTVKNRAEARAAVDSLVALGVDFIKVHQQISRDAYFAVAQQARKHGIPFVGHKPNVVSIPEMVEAGQKSIEHIFGIPGSDAGVYPLLKESDTYVTPTLTIVDKIARHHELSQENDPRSKYLSPALKKSWKDQLDAWGEDVDKTVEMIKGLRPEMFNRVNALQEAGVMILAGTDLGVTNIYPGSSLHEELALLVEAGLSPLEALQTATINPAKFFKKEEMMGNVRKGKRADLVLLNANPLEDISNTKRIHMVIYKSKVYDQDKLSELLLRPSKF